MIRGMFKGLGKLALWAATAAFLTAVSLFVFGSFLTTYPILRLSPRDKRIRVTSDLAVAAMAAIQTFSQKDSVTKD